MNDRGSDCCLLAALTTTLTLLESFSSALEDVNRENKIVLGRFSLVELPVAEQSQSRLKPGRSANPSLIASMYVLVC